MERSLDKHPFEEVHKSIVSGDIVQFHLLLDQDTLNVRNILNGLVSYRKKARGQKLLELPLALAACSGNTEMLITVMELIKDMNQQDGSGNNIIHSLVLLSDEHPVVVCDMYSTLMSHTDHSMRQKLLTTENQEQLTALSLAAHICVPEIMHCILHTDGVYRFELDINEPYKEVMYKFQKENQPVEILQQITCVPENRLKRFTDSGILHTSPLKDVREDVNRKGNYTFYVWIVSVIACLIGYGCYLRAYLVFGSVPDQRYDILIVVLFGICVLEFARNLYVNRKNTVTWWKQILRKNQPVIVTSVYTSEMLFFFMFFVLTVIDLAHPYCDNDKKVRHTLHAITSFFAVGSLLFFLQAYPRTAYLIAVVQKMFEETLAFIMMGFLFYAAFVSVFYVLETPFQCIDSAAATNTTTNLQNLPGTMYDVFLWLLNIKTPDDVYFSDSNVPAMSLAAYVFAIMVWPVMLMNFLIALYNDRMQTITQHREVITAVQNLNIMLLAHDSYYVPMQKAKKRMHKLLGFEPETPTDAMVVYTSEQLLT